MPKPGIILSPAFSNRNNMGNIKFKGKYNFPTEKYIELIVIMCAAFSFGYYVHRLNDWNFVFKRTTPENGSETINVYWNAKNRLYTFGSAMDHPTKGKTQLFRKYVEHSLIIKLMENPRLHTGKGYRKRK